MLSQDVVLSLLQASITGAGLVLAIYALIIPLSKRLFEHNVVDFLELLKFTGNKLDDFFKGKMDKDSADKAKNYAVKIFQSWSFPTYLRFGVGATFFGYIFTTLASIFWVVDWEKTTMNSLIAPAFTVTTLIFLVVGLISIKDIHKIMRQDFNEMIKSLKESENKT